LTTRAVLPGIRIRKLLKGLAPRFVPPCSMAKLETQTCYVHIGHPLLQVIYLREPKKLYLHQSACCTGLYVSTCMHTLAVKSQYGTLPGK
jgi:hypothetical protein